jgi:hypothetical protein
VRSARSAKFWLVLGKLRMPIICRPRKREQMRAGAHVL